MPRCIVLRTITLGVALSLLAVACALVEQPVPPGTTPFRVEVQNDRGPVELSVTTPAGTISGAVQPASLPAGSTSVTIYLPRTGEWAIAVNGREDEDILGRLDVNRECSSLKVRLHPGGGSESGYTCES